MIATGRSYPGDVVVCLALGCIVAAAGWFTVVPVLRRLVDGHAVVAARHARRAARVGELIRVGYPSW